MSTSHHGDAPDPKESENMQRLLAQLENRAKRQYNAGRISVADEGVLAYAIAADKEHKRVIIDFGKPVNWLGFTAKDAVALAEVLIAKAKEVSTEPLTVNL